MIRRCSFCPTCHHHIEEDFRNESIGDYENDVKRHNALIEDVLKLNEKVADDIKSVDEELKKYSDACNKIDSLESNYDTIQRMIKSLSKKNHFLSHNTLAML